MPCPFFEPVSVSGSPEQPGSRLPLIDEYDGFCHAKHESFPVEQDLRYRYCNHGYSRGACPHFPAEDARCATRFDIRRVEESEVQLLWIEERAYAPASWRTISYRIDSGALIPDLPDECSHAQALAFCRSYLSRFRS